MTDDEKFERGVADFNAGRFFEAHEIWEELWLVAAEPGKTFLQGLIQVTAAFHHHARGNPRGMQSLLAAGLAKLAECPEDFRGLAIGELRRELENWHEEPRAGEQFGPRTVPKIRTAKSNRHEKSAADE
ncbi:MAG TPA: DUF309 domain-containing protein [Candidatus Acidoferrales bacterium]|jgi:hypothetical protein|nr:DUF309 domain-containing protein [Candidatus Acidoferrales bacterium]